MFVFACVCVWLCLFVCVYFLVYVCVGDYVCVCVCECWFMCVWVITCVCVSFYLFNCFFATFYLYFCNENFIFPGFLVHLFNWILFCYFELERLILYVKVILILCVYRCFYVCICFLCLFVCVCKCVCVCLSVCVCVCVCVCVKGVLDSTSLYVTAYQLSLFSFPHTIFRNTSHKGMLI